MFKPFVRTALAASLLVFVTACEQKPAEPAAPVGAAQETPDGAIRESVALLKQGDIAGFMRHSMPPAEYEKAKVEWSREVNAEPLTDEERKRFAAMMEQLTEPDAEQKLYAEIEPQLKTLDAQYQQQIPMYVAMGTSWLRSMVQLNKDLSEDSRQQTIAAIDAAGAWVQKTRLADPEAVKKVLAITIKAARAMDLKTADQARALDLEQSMQKARIAFLGLKEALGVYGFSLDQTLDSVQPQVISNDGKTAKVRISYTLFDSPLSGESEMVNVDGHWYGKETIEKLAQKHAEETEADSDGNGAEDAPAAED